ncbi:WD40 repeat domain-containing protein [Streptomyces sp. NPDC059466]|uniref:WD40 repeat domain-containing protein n=1 Tax=unclassified Streptomyces TaxID=2593676 RepID=UPI00367D4BF4
MTKCLYGLYGKTRIFLGGLSVGDLSVQAVWSAQPDLKGHLSPVTSVALCPVSGDVLTASYDGYVIRWDSAIQIIRWTVRFPDLVNSISVNTNGALVAAACADGFAYVLDAVSGFERFRLGSHRDDVNDVAWNPSHDKLAVVCDAGEPGISIWDIGQPTPSRVIVEGHQHGVFSVSYSPSGERYATASEDGTVRVWRDREEIGKLPHGGDVETVAWSPTDMLLATGCDDGALRLWNTDTLELAHELRDSAASVRRVAFSLDGSLVLAGCYDGKLRVYDTGNGEMVGEHSQALQWERAAVFDQDGAVVVGSFGARPTRTADARVASAPPPATWGINALCSSRRGIYFATDCGYVGDLDGAIQNVADTMICDISGTVNGDLLVRTTDYLGRVIDVTEDASHVAWTVGGGPANTLTETPTGTVVVGSYDGHLSHWTPNGILLGRAPAHHGPIKKVAWSEQLKAVVVGSSDDTVSIWSVEDEIKIINRLKTENLALVNDVHPLLTAQAIALASRDRMLRIWYPKDGTVTTFPIVHSKSVKAITGTPDDSLIVTSSYDGSLCFWRLDGNQQLDSYRQVFHHGKPGVPALAVHGTRLFSGGWNGTIAEWDFGGNLIRTYEPREWHQ